MPDPLALLLDEALPPAARAAAARDLAVRDPISLAPLAATVDDELLSLLKEALVATDAAPALSRLAADAATEPHQRLACTRALRLVPLREPERDVVRALAAGVPELAREAVLVLAAHPVDADLEALIRAAAYDSPDVRYFAAVGLGALTRAGSAPAQHALRARLHVETDPLVRRELDRGLGPDRREA